MWTEKGFFKLFLYYFSFNAAVIHETELLCFSVRDDKGFLSISSMCEIEKNKVVFHSVWMLWKKKKTGRDFPGSKVAKTLHSGCRGPSFNLWLDPTCPTKSSHVATKKIQHAATKTWLRQMNNYMTLKNKRRYISTIKPGLKSDNLNKHAERKWLQGCILLLLSCWVIPNTWSPHGL